MTHFVYMWFDKARKMFYVGMHSGSIDDGYISSSSWLSAEVRYRPNDFKRRIIKIHTSKTEAKQHEGQLLSLIKECEFGSKYYNYKHGKPKGSSPWNKGKSKIYSKETLEKMSSAKIGKPSATKGMTMSTSAENGKRSAKKLSQTVTGRKLATRKDGSRYWVYPVADCLVDKEQSANPHSITV